MNTYDKSSLVLIPSGIKDGKIYSQRPENGSGDFTFSRSTAATRVGPSGYIEKETQNLLLQSNSFNTTWVNSNTTETGGQVGYDGSNDAWLLSKSFQFGRLEQPYTFSGLYAFSVYAKANTLNWIAIGTTASIINSGCYFDLQNGVVGSSGNSVINKSIQSMGNGWYRCVAIIHNPTDSYFRIYPADGNGDVSGTSGSIYIQDAQLEQGLVARDYIETTTSAVYGGITDNIPRLDYNGSCPSLLLEPQRTNLITHSEYLENAQFRAFSQILNTTDTTPEGSSNARVLAYNGGTNDHYLGYAPSVTNGETYTFSVFLKKKELRYVALIFLNDFAGQYFDLENGTILGTINGGPTNSKIEDVGNGWYRCSITDVATSTTKFSGVYLSENGTSYGGITPTNTDGVYIYGIQLEEGSYATSYIPTYGSAAVTRNKDFCYDAGNTATFNSTEGVFYFEGSALADDGTNRFLSLSDGTTDNYIYFRYVSTSNQYLFRTQIGGVTINTLSAYLADTTENHKFAFKFKSGDYAMWVDGVEISTDTSSTIFAPNVLSNMEFSFPTDGGGGFPSKTKQIMVFNTALTDEELAALTTI